MTARLDPMHPLDALYAACQRYPGGVEALAARLGSTRATLYNKLRQQVTTHNLAYSDELTRLLHMLADAKVEGWADTLRALCWQHGHVAIALPADLAVPAGDVLDVLNLLLVSLGGLAGQLTQWRGARAQNRSPAPHEVQAAQALVADAVAQLVLLGERLTDDFALRDDLDAVLAGGAR